MRIRHNFTRAATVFLSVITASLFAYMPSAPAQEGDQIEAKELYKAWRRVRGVDYTPQTRRARAVVFEDDTADSTSEMESDPKPATVDSETEVNLYFGFELNSATLREPAVAMAQLQEVAEVMKKLSKERFVIEGHTCDLGVENHNDLLSARRAAAIRNRLVSLGVSADQLEVLAFGESAPKVANLSEDNRRQNRRVTVFRLQRK